MAFPQEVIEKAWLRSNGYCECTKTGHAHEKEKICCQPLIWEHRGKSTLSGCWDAYHIVSGGPDTVYNCVILCCKCHFITKSNAD